MKPKDLLDAMDGISEEYITEAMPNSVRGGESRAAASGTNADAKAAAPAPQNADSSRSIQHRPIRKDSTMSNSNHNLWHRIATGAAAAAACNVFVGGAWFIAQQAIENQPDTAGSNVETAEVNFLGGQGDIRVADSVMLMYDDSKYYFRYADFEAERSIPETGSLHLRSHYLSDIFWDGEQFYRAEGTALYRIDIYGKHIDEKPFYTIDTDAAKAHLNSEITETNFNSIQKLTDGSYSISYAYQSTNIWTIESCIYQPESGQPAAVMPGDGYWKTIMQDGSDFIAMNSSGGLCRVTLDPLNIETMNPLPASCSNATSQTLSDGCIYLCCSNDDFDSDKPLSYGKYDLASQEYTEILHEVEFNYFIPYKGKIYAHYADGSKIICANPDMSDVEVICDFTDTLTDAQIDALADATQGEFPSPTLDAVDDRCFVIHMDFADMSNGYAVIDRETLKTQLFIQKDEDDAPENNTETNLLGGKGEIHAARNCWFLYDDSNVYFDYCNVTGSRNTGAQISDTVRNSADCRLICDGENVYAAAGFCIYRLDRNGQMEDEPFFTVSDADVEAFKAAHDGITPYVYAFKIQKLTDEFYHVFYALSETEDVPLTDAFSLPYKGYLLNANTRECRNIPIYDDCPEPFRTYRDGEYFYCMPKGTESFCRFTLPDYEYEQFTNPYAQENGTIVKVQDGVLYYTLWYKNQEAEAPVLLCKYDVNTGKNEVISENLEYRSLLSCGDQYFAVTDDLKQILTLDKDLKNQKILFDCAKDTPQEIKDELQQIYNEIDDSAHTTVPGDMITIEYLSYEMDEKYLALKLCNGPYVLLDRETGAFRFYREPSLSNMPVSGTASAQDTDAAAAATAANVNDTEIPADDNIFGGSGNIIPLDWDSTGGVGIYRDNTSFYFIRNNGPDWQWYRAPSGGGKASPLPARISGAQTYSGFLHSDGNSVYTDDLTVITEGYKGALHFNIKDAFEGLLPDISDSMGYKLNYIWHIRSRYFMVLEWTDYTKPIKCETAITDIYEMGRISVWTDENGNILDRKMLDDTDVNKSFFCDEEGEHIYSIAEDANVPIFRFVNENLDRTGIADIDLRQYLDADDMMRYTAVTGDKIIFGTSTGKLCGIEDGVCTVLDDNWLRGKVLLSSDGIYYSRWNEEQKSGIYQLTEAGKEPTLIYQSDDPNLYICGFASSEAMHTPFYIVVSSIDRFKIIDPSNGSVIRELD